MWAGGVCILPMRANAEARVLTTCRTHLRGGLCIAIGSLHAGGCRGSSRGILLLHRLRAGLGLAIAACQEEGVRWKWWRGRHWQRLGKRPCQMLNALVPLRRQDWTPPGAHHSPLHRCRPELWPWPQTVHRQSRRPSLGSPVRHSLPPAAHMVSRSTCFRVFIKRNNRVDFEVTTSAEK